jgi:hypothetical protein
MTDDDLRIMVRGIIKRRNLRVDMFDDFLQEVRLRIYTFGLMEGRSELNSVAFHVVYAHKSYKPRPRILTEHQFSDDYDHDVFFDSNYASVDAKDEIEELDFIVNTDKFTVRQKEVFNIMRQDPYLTLDAIGKRMVPTAPRNCVFSIIKTLAKKLGDYSICEN